jgi:hypothetical protein
MNKFPRKHFVRYKDSQESSTMVKAYNLLYFIISSTSYMWELVFYSSVENICMRHSITNKGEAHKAGLVNPGKMMVTCVLEIYFACINDILIMFCVCSEGVVFYIFHFMNQCTSRKNKHILLAINTCPCIYLTGFLFSLFCQHNVECFICCFNMFTHCIWLCEK